MANQKHSPLSSPSSSALPESAANHTSPRGAAGAEPLSHGKAKPAPSEAKDTLREVVETVVFVVVLVLLLKCFTAEVFVIPTGSMATTLWGYQKEVVCPQCGFKFPVNCSDQVERTPPIKIAGCTCPNCLYEIDFTLKEIDKTPDSGDRVLVAKYFYDTGLVDPQRLDVVVFKYPMEPQKNYAAMNYIKRLIGLSGETIGIYYGKLYVLPPDKGRHYDEGDVRKEDLWRAQFMHEGDARQQLLQENSPFTIIRKPPAKILALRRIVYDNDHPPVDLMERTPPWPARWFGGAAWEANDPHGFHAAGGNKDEIQWLRYRNVLRHGQEPELITDFMGYNSKAVNHGWKNGTIDHSTSGRNWVGDLILEAEVTVDKPEGEFVLELSKGIDRFRARWQLASGTCTLSRIAAGRETELGSQPTKLKDKGKYQVRFANVDERLVVWVNKDLPFGDGVAYDPPQERGPFANDLEPASIGTKGGAVSVQHLKLWRDTYYTVSVTPSPADASAIQVAIGGGYGDKEQRLHELLSTPARWDDLRHLPCTTLYVQPGHYLCLGDNSPESSDGRTWGLVPQRLLLGRALWVYWPYNRFGPIR